ncbi:winged helix-turn-helix transcriptional regulator [Nocardia sp. NBC_00416]|uniref:winged helix-turn-helix transcriptional regulator n=1 Tax=Nocardia sp. NBC_00416 TaxID=2975991 RepID=UPI002E1E0862
MHDAGASTPLPPGGANALARALGLLGDEWTLLILRCALLGAKRYSEFRAELPISYAVLTSRLETLVRENMMDRHAYQENPIRKEYVLTPRGRSVWAVLVAIWDWERRWIPEQPEVMAAAVRHRVCGRNFSAVLCCSHCGKRVTVGNVGTRWGPSGSWPRSVPDATTRRRSPGRSRGERPSFLPETMAVCGNRWSSALVGAAFQGVGRFTDFQEALCVPPSLLTERLQCLCEHGVLSTVRIPERPDRVEYRLTDKGRAFFPVIVTVLQWAERWYHAEEGPAMLWTHRECGAEFRGVLTCDQCAGTLRGEDVDVMSR